MSPIASMLLTVLLCQPPSSELEEQREFEAALMDRDRFNYVWRYVNENQYLSGEFMELVANATQSEIDEVSHNAISLLENIGPQAADYDTVILPFLAHEDPEFRIAAIDCLRSMRPAHFYPEIARLAVLDEDDSLHYGKFDSVHFAAIRVLVKSESLEAVPYILAIYLDADTWRSSEAIRQTSNCLPDLQQALIPSLVQLLGHQEMGFESLSNDMHYETPIREIALDTLGNMGELAASYLAEIEQMRSLEEDPELRIRYAAAILKIGGYDDKQIDLLRSALLDSKEPGLLHRSCRVCAEVPWVAETLSAELLALINGEDPWIRESAVDAICATDMNTPEIIAALNECAVDYTEDTWTCWTAMEALAERGGLIDPMESVLRAMESRGEYEGDAQYATQVLACSMDDAAILQQLEAEFVDANDDRREALIVLLEWKGADAELLQRLLELPLLDEQREQLEFHLIYAPRPDVVEPLTDWRLPEAIESVP
jgi:hypothetical protein